MLNAQVIAEVRATADILYAMAVAPYLQGIILEPAMASLGGKPDPKVLRSFAALAVKCAPYVKEAQGRAQIDDADLWKDMQVKQAGGNS